MVLMNCLAVICLIIWVAAAKVESLAKKGIIESSELFGTHISFIRSPDKGTQYFYLVHPQGWVNSEILVKEGDILKFEASGKVNLMLDDIIRSINDRRGVESKLGGELPEKKFTKDDIYMMSLISN